MGYDLQGVSALLQLNGPDPDAGTPMAAQVSQWLGRAVRYRSAYYRHGEPEDAFWIALDLQ